MNPARRRRFGIEEAWHLGIGEPFNPDIVRRVREPADLTLRAERWSDGKELELKTSDEAVPGEATIVFDRPDLYELRMVDPSGSPRSRMRRYAVVDPRLELRMYTLIPRVAGPISEWTRHLDHLEELGFDAIQLLPLTEMGSSRSPYSISDHFVIDSDFQPGTPAERLAAFDDFIETCARRSIRVCVDLVLNHVAVDGRVAHEHPEWLVEDPAEPDGIRRAGWSDGTNWYPWRDLAKLEFLPFAEASRDELYAFLDGYALFWAERAARTGGIIRLDNLHSADEAYLQHLLRELRADFPELIVLGELFGTERMIWRRSNSCGVNLLLGTPWEHRFVPELRGYLGYVHRMHNRMRFHFPASSHDSGTITEEFGNVLATAPRLVTSFLLGPGSTGMVQGIEYGEPRRIPFIGPPAPYRTKGNEDFRDLIRTLNQLHREEAVFRRAGNLIFVDDHHVAIIAALRIDPATGSPLFLVCGNFDTQSPQRFELTPNSVGSATLHDQISGGSIRWGERPVEIALAPGGIGVYRIEFDSAVGMIDHNGN